MTRFITKPRKGFLLCIALIAVCLVYVPGACAQSVCPINIDFEQGSFLSWKCASGYALLSGGKNTISVSTVAPISNRHQLIPRGTSLDPYGKFPISAPDGSNYSVKLGNDGLGGEADQISYTFTVPANKTDFVITYQYAIVLQDPGHSPAEQPRFTAKVFDITTNSYVNCGSFDYVATAALPGFKNANISQVVYKDWTPASINLYGYQGHQLRLEFTTADCTQSGHFGYAYVDVNNSCSSLITGADFCPSGPSFILTGPSGFDKYNWYNADRSKLLGTTQKLTLPTAGSDGETVLVDLIPFAGFGCNYTTSTVLHALPVITFKVTDPAAVCFPSTVDLTAASVKTGSDTDLNYTYWKDSAASTSLPSPAAVGTSGTYYIKATAPSGCFDIKPVNVVVNALPVLVIANPPKVCLLEATDITAPAVTAGSSAGITLSYWMDAAATQAITDAKHLYTAGTYYIKATNASGCSVTKPVIVDFYALPVLTITDPLPVCFPLTTDITSTSVTTGSDANLQLSYWTDAATTVPVTDPARVQVTGTYYIKATNVNGCITIKPVKVTNYPLPQMVINNPAEVCWPEKIDLTRNAVTAGSSGVSKLSYWLDKYATIPITKPEAVADSNGYYIKAENIFGCSVIKPVTVNIHQLPVVKVTDPPKVYTPNTVNIAAPELMQGSTAKLNYTYWEDAAATIRVNDPKRVTKSGVYYIKGENEYGCFVIKPVDVTVTIIPQILVPKAFTPTQLTNNKLYPFLLGVKIFKYIKVYNRWGTLVFETKNPDPESGWDGSYKGARSFLETFTWYAEGVDYVGNTVHKSGNTIMLK